MNWKGQLLQVAVFLLLPLLGAAGSWAAFRGTFTDDLSRGRWLLVVVTVFLATRAGTHALVFGLLGYHGGDDLGVWESVARAVLEGGEHTGFLGNLYGPLLPYVLAAGLWIGGGNHPSTIDVPFVLADAGALFLLYRLARDRWGESPARRITLATMLVPLLWHGEVVRTQEESLLAFFLMLVLTLLRGGREVGACAAAVLGTLATKALFPFWVLPVLLAPGPTTGRSALRALAAGTATVLGLAVAAQFGWDWRGLASRAPGIGGSSSWVLLTRITGGALPYSPLAGLGITALGCAAAALAALPRRTESGGLEDRTALGVAAVTATYFVLSPLSLAAYIVQGLPLLLWWLWNAGTGTARPGSWPWWAFLGLLAWNVLSIPYTSEHWPDHPWLILLFVAYWGFVAACAVLGRSRTVRPEVGS